MPQEKISAQQFAQSIKAKYPQYKDVDDNVLAEKMIAKYPQYAEKVERTFDAVAFRQKEILSILTNAEKGLGQDKWTKEFQQVIQELIEEGKYSKNKLIMLFE